MQENTHNKLYLLIELVSMSQLYRLFVVATVQSVDITIMYFIIELKIKVQGDEDNIPYLSEAAGLLFSGTNCYYI